MIKLTSLLLLLLVLQLCNLQAVIERHEAAVKRVKESHERVEACRHEMSLMSAKHQQLVDTLSQLEADIEQRKREYEQVLYTLFNDMLDAQQTSLTLYGQ